MSGGQAGSAGAPQGAEDAVPQAPSANSDPFRVLGLAIDASEEEIRKRYLELVKQFPPERDAVRFQQIQRAYDDCRDPLAMASWFLASTLDDPRPWEEVIADEERRVPRLATTILLSLGNR